MIISLQNEIQQLTKDIETERSLSTSVTLDVSSKCTSDNPDNELIQPVTLVKVPEHVDVIELTNTLR